MIFEISPNKVLQSDGSDVSASINAASLALVDAGIQMKGSSFLQ